MAATTLTPVLPMISATAYLTPLREGGSLPGLMEADDLGTYVVKFTGAGQGPKTLVAEIVVGELGRLVGVPVPRLALIEVDAEIGRREPDEEVQELVVSSAGINLAIDFLPGAVGYDRSFAVPGDAAARLLWLDAFVANVDRSVRNTNLLIWHKRLWAIDHGACLYFHHGWSGGVGSAERFAHQPYDASDHVLVAHRSGVPAVDASLAPRVTRDLLGDVLSLVPDEWLEPVPGASAPADLRAAYADFLLARVSGERAWLPVAGAA